MAGFGCDTLKNGIVAAGAIIAYLKNTQKTKLPHITGLKTYSAGEYMQLDPGTLRELSVITNPRTQDERDTLVWVLDKAVTAMGKRLLRRWLIRPLLDIQLINERLNAIEALKAEHLSRKRIREELKGIPDIERLNARISLGRTNPRDLVSLKQGLFKIPKIKSILERIPQCQALQGIYQDLDPLEEVAGLIERAINDEAPLSSKELGIIKKGFDPELDRLIEIMRDSRNWIMAFAQEEQARTGINSLKVGYNRVFGYYIEVTKPNLHLIPPDYIRRQTLANAERFITPKLKEKEEEVLSAEERRLEIEATLFAQIREQVSAHAERIKKTAQALAALDVYCALGEESGYVRPHLVPEPVLDIRAARHPVLEKTLNQEQFVPNDIFLDDTSNQILIITGPNMAGKSTILRQVALICLMAQAGFFVPAESCTIGLVDKVFTRIGASDDIARGQSTFMVEMAETANILRNATTRSLVILDEVGRGTSTYDGMSIAWAVVEALHSLHGKGVRTLFATHYH